MTGFLKNSHRFLEVHIIIDLNFDSHLYFTTFLVKIVYVNECVLYPDLTNCKALNRQLYREESLDNFEDNGGNFEVNQQRNNINNARNKRS